MSTQTVSPYHLSAEARVSLLAATPSHDTPLQRAQRELAAHAVRLQRADAARRSPFWPFGQLTAAQQRARAAQEEAMRCGVLRRAPEALL